MNTPFNFRGGIRSKILLLAIIPVLSVSVALTWYYVATQRSHLTQDMHRFGTSTAEYLAIAGQLAMYADDLDSLQQIARGPARNHSIHAVAFFDADGGRLVSVSAAGELHTPALTDQQSWPGDQFRDALLWYFRAPIELEAGTMSDYGEPTEQHSQLLGWAVVALSQQELHKTQRDNVLIGILILVVATLLVSIAAWLLSHRIYQPIRELTGIVETMESGDLSVEAKLAGEHEIQVLARVINRLASSLNQTNIRLKQEVDEATGDLRQALAELERALGAKDQFLAHMSHELRTPLTTILGFTRRLEHTPLSTEQAEYRHAIAHSSTLLLSVINDILDFSRLQYRGISLEDMDFNLENELEDIVSMHAHNAYEKSIELILFIDSNVPETVRGDATRLRQILNNLLANAVKFTSSGEIIVHVAQERADDSEAEEELNSEGGTLYLQVSVRDSGIGISAEDLDKLFKPFGQADTSINRRFGGSGLGLVICQQLVELMGGEISIDSEPSRGTTVSFTAQLKRTSNECTAVSMPQRSDPIAVVAQNPWSRRALRSQLTAWSRQVFALDNTDRLQELLGEGRQDFAAVVINLDPGALAEPWLEGALGKLRNNYRGPVILLSSTADVEDTLIEGIAQKFAPVRCLSKPARRKNLLKWLDTVSHKQVYFRQSVDVSAATDDPSEGCLKGIAILIAEDNHLNQKLFATMLESEEAMTILADDGAQAVDRFKQSACELVLMDAHMPGVDGIAACRQIIAHAEKVGRRVTVVGLTADTLEGERERFLQAGASEVLYKPVDEQALFEALCRHVGRKFLGRTSTNLLSDTISKKSLTAELKQLTTNLRRELEAGQLIDCRETIHQLLGLSGMYGMNEYRRVVIELRECVAERRESEIIEKLELLDALIRGNSDQPDN